MRIKSFALGAALLLSHPIFADAKTLEYPKGGGEFSITFPDDWTADIQDGILASAPASGGFSLTVFPARNVKNAKEAFADVMKSLRNRFSDFKPDAAPSEIEFNGIKFYGGDTTGKLKSANGLEMKSTIMIFTLDGEHYFALFSTGTLAADTTRGPECLIILNSIKSTKDSAKRATNKRT